MSYRRQKHTYTLKKKNQKQEIILILTCFANTGFYKSFIRFNDAFYLFLITYLRAYMDFWIFNNITSR